MSAYKDNVVVFEWHVSEHALKRERLLNGREGEVHQRHCNKEGGSVGMHAMTAKTALKRWTRVWAALDTVEQDAVETISHFCISCHPK